MTQGALRWSVGKLVFSISVLAICLVLLPAGESSSKCSPTLGPHRVPQPVPPGLPQQAVPAVVEAVGAGELVAGVPGVSSLSADHRQEGQPAQIHLGDGERLDGDGGRGIFTVRSTHCFHLLCKSFVESTNFFADKTVEVAVSMQTEGDLMYY